MDELRQLREQVARLQDQVGGGRRSRRQILRLAGAAAVGGAAAVMAAGDAAATTGPMQFGATNNAGASGTVLTSSYATALEVDGTGAGSTAVFGYASGSGTGVIGKVQGPTENGWGVAGFANGGLGYGLVGMGGAAQLRLTPNVGFTEMPSTGVHFAGELHTNDGGLYYCVATGTPGTWRAVARPESAGALIPVTPARVYDSRHDLTYMGPPNRPISTGQTRTISVAHKVDATGVITVLDYVPTGVTAIAYNLTVVNTVGTNGWLAVNPGGVATVSASAINWSSAGLTTANASLVSVNVGRQVTVICGGTATSCNFIIDVVGYYR